jgi:hypothetical protein
MSQVQGAFGLLDITVLRPFSLGARFETYEPFISLIFQIFSGRGKPRIPETTDNESADTGVRRYTHTYFKGMTKTTKIPIQISL